MSGDWYLSHPGAVKDRQGRSPLHKFFAVPTTEAMLNAILSQPPVIRLCLRSWISQIRLVLLAALEALMALTSWWLPARSRHHLRQHLASSAKGHRPFGSTV